MIAENKNTLQLIYSFRTSEAMMSQITHLCSDKFHMLIKEAAGVRRDVLLSDSEVFPELLFVPEYLPPLETQQKAWRHLGGEIATT